MNIPEHMTAYCAGGRKRAGELGDTGAFEVWEDLERLFRRTAEALENEPAATVRPFLAGMSRALDTAAVWARVSGPAAMADRLAGRARDGETPGETCVYGDLLRLYVCLDRLYGAVGGPDGDMAGGLSDAAGELGRLLAQENGRR